MVRGLARNRRGCTSVIARFTINRKMGAIASNFAYTLQSDALSRTVRAAHYKLRRRLKDYDRVRSQSESRRSHTFSRLQLVSQEIYKVSQLWNYSGTHKSQAVSAPAERAASCSVGESLVKLRSAARHAIIVPSSSRQ